MNKTRLILDVSHCGEALNLDYRRRLGGSTQEEFEKILEALAMVRAYKIDHYGDSRLTEIQENRKIELLLSFSDIHRKYIRYKKQVNELTINYKDLLETLVDLSNYGVQAVQILLKIMEGFHAKDSAGHRSELGTRQTDPTPDAS